MTKLMIVLVLVVAGSAALGADDIQLIGVWDGNESDMVDFPGFQRFIFQRATLTNILVLDPPTALTRRGPYELDWPYIHWTYEFENQDEQITETFEIQVLSDGYLLMSPVIDGDDPPSEQQLKDAYNDAYHLWRNDRPRGLEPGFR